eukprot:XP_020407485.1 gamma-aminobutyrate transaminase 1, mitochondrial [Zea mays]
MRIACWMRQSDILVQHRLLSLKKMGDSSRFKGHGMLAPFTAGWQGNDLHPLIIERSEGSYVYDINGNKYLDSLAGLWCTTLVQSNPPQPRREGLQATISASLKQKNNSNASKVLTQF